MRVLDFADGFTSASAPIAVVSTTITGSTSSPVQFLTGSPVTPAGAASEVMYVQGHLGAITVTPNPRIVAGTQVGQRLRLIGTHDTNTLTIPNGNGVRQNGDIVLSDGSVIDYEWNGSAWQEDSRNDI